MNKNIFIFIISIFLFSACTRNTENDRLRIGISSSLILGNNNPVFIQRNSNTWETLSFLDNNYEPQPCIAEKWECKNNGKLWIITLKKNIYFHNGELLIPEHVVKNIYRFKNHPELDFYSVYTYLDTAFIQNEKIYLKFSKPTIDYPRKIGHYFAGIFHPNSFDEKGRIVNLIATGSYQLTKYKIGTYEVIEHYERYREENPKYKKVEFRVISDPTLRVLALVKGDIDIIALHGGVQSFHLQYLNKYPFIKIDSFKLGITHYLVFNCNSKIFKHITNRIALNSIINRYELVTYVLQNKGYPAVDFFVPDNKEWSKNRFNLYSINHTCNFINNNEVVNIVLNQGDISNWGYKLTAEYICSLLNSNYIKSKIKIVEPGTYKKMINNGEYDITLYPLSIPTGTPELFLRNLVYSKGLFNRNSSNISHIKNNLIDSLIECALYAENENKQNVLYNDILNNISDSCFILPLYHEKYYLAYNKKLSNIKMDPFLKLELNQIR